MLYLQGVEQLQQVHKDRHTNLGIEKLKNALGNGMVYKLFCVLHEYGCFLLISIESNLSYFEQTLHSSMNVYRANKWNGKYLFSKIFPFKTAAL